MGVVCLLGWQGKARQCLVLQPGPSKADADRRALEVRRGQELERTGVPQPEAGELLFHL